MRLVNALLLVLVYYHCVAIGPDSSLILVNTANGGSMRIDARNIVGVQRIGLKDRNNFYTDLLECTGENVRIIKVKQTAKNIMEEAKKARVTLLRCHDGQYVNETFIRKANGFYTGTCFLLREDDPSDVDKKNALDMISNLKGLQSAILNIFGHNFDVARRNIGKIKEIIEDNHYSRFWVRHVKCIVEKIELAVPWELYWKTNEDAITYIYVITSIPKN